MHGAPSVNYPVGRSRFAGIAQLIAWCAGVAGLLAWWALVDASPFAVFCAGAAVLVFGATALWGWLNSPSGMLAWDGDAWTWSDLATSEVGAPEPVLDFQRWMLVRWSGNASIRWLWLEHNDRAPWASLRRAVYSRARQGTQRSVPEGEATP